MNPRELTGLALLAVTLIACRSESLDTVPAELGSTSAQGAGGAAGGTSAVGGSGETGGGGLGGGLGGGGASPTGPSIVTWNLENFPLTAGAMEQAAELIAELGADVVALQEVAEPSAFYALVDELDDYDGVLNDDPGAYLRLGLLHRTDRVVVTDVQTLFQDDWYAFPRPPLKARISIDGSAPMDFVAVVLHLKAQLDSESQDRRRAGCEALDAWVRQQLATAEEQDYVLLGDLNDKLTDPPQWNVFDVFLDQPDVYTFLTMPLAQAGEHSYIPFESLIDHVLVTADALGEVGAGETEVLALEQQVPDYEDLTDHRPIRTWLLGSP